MVESENNAVQNSFLGNVLVIFRYKDHIFSFIEINDSHNLEVFARKNFEIENSKMMVREKQIIRYWLMANAISKLYYKAC